MIVPDERGAMPDDLPADVEFMCSMAVLAEQHAHDNVPWGHHNSVAIHMVREANGELVPYPMMLDNPGEPRRRPGEALTALGHLRPDLPDPRHEGVALLLEGRISNSSDPNTTYRALVGAFTNGWAIKIMRPEGDPQPRLALYEPDDDFSDPIATQLRAYNNYVLTGCEPSVR